MQAKRVLIVDDFEDGAQTLANLLQLQGHTCALTGTPLDAIAAVETFAPDIVLMEWRLRCGNAIGLASTLRELSQRPLIVVALSTADEPAGFRVREQLDAYLLKPATPRALERLFEIPSS
ncbi:MAG TPA: response regulator [Kofleriaceae bacterium]|nr:response regulator [Kofleriaceae bacterium]